MGSVYSLVSVALSVFHCCVAEIHAMLCALALLAPSEVPYAVVVGVSLALVSAPSEVPAYSDGLSVVCCICEVAQIEPGSSVVSVVGVQW